MKQTTTDMRLMSLLDLESSLVKHHERLATIYKNDNSSSKNDNSQWQDNLMKFHRQKIHDRHVRSQKRLDKINHENSIIHSKLLSQRSRKSMFSPAEQKEPHRHFTTVRKRQQQKIDEQNFKFVQRLVTARGDVQPEKIKKHQIQHNDLLQRISKSKRREKVRRIIRNKLTVLNEPIEYYLPQIKRDKSSKSHLRMRSVSSTRPY